MPTRKRISSVKLNITGTGGGGGSAPEVVVGPDFGEGSGSDGKTFSIHTAVDMPLLNLDATFPVTTTVDGDIALSFASNPAVSVSASMDDLGLAATLAVTASTVTMPDLSLSATLSIASTVTGTVSKTQFFRTAGTFTWTPPTAGVTSAVVELWGASGVGGAVNGLNAVGARPRRRSARRNPAHVRRRRVLTAGAGMHRRRCPRH